MAWASAAGGEHRAGVDPGKVVDELWDELRSLWRWPWLTCELAAEENSLSPHSACCYLTRKHLCLSVPTASQQETRARMSVPALVVHGGAGDVTDERARIKLLGVQLAARHGWSVLAAGGSALDAVEAAVKMMEDDQNFNAGLGSVLNLDGDVETDALIMDGSTLKAGAVAALRDVKNPVSVARLVMERSPHILLSGDGAARFSHEHGVPKLPAGALVTEFETKCLGNFKNKRQGPAPGVGTVGAVAVDSEGHVATALSTGGTCGKLPGRVGDTPLLGCGGYCDDAVGATASTGHGESIIRACLAASVFALMEQGVPVQEATDRATARLTQRTGGRAGTIAVSRLGEIGVSTTTDRMAWASAAGGELRAGVDSGKVVVELL